MKDTIENNQRRKEITMKEKLFAIMAACTLCLLMTSTSYSIDTTETFAPGAVTDYEGYYAYGWDDSNSAHGLEFLIGGGFTETFSYLVTFGYAQETPDEGDSVSVYGGLGLGLIWTVIDNENALALDILPALTFEPNDVNDEGTSVKPNFQGLSYGAAVELNIMYSSVIQPYIIAGYTGYKDTAEVGDDEYEDDPYDLPLKLGIMVPLGEGMELLAQLDWTLNEDTKAWVETDRSISLGFNMMLTDNLELITEIGMGLKVEDENGNEAAPANTGLGIGAIYAL